MSKIDVTFEDFRMIVKRLSPSALEDVLKRARVVIANPDVDRCDYCKQIPLRPWRAGRRFCTRACRQKAYRQRKQSKQ